MCLRAMQVPQLGSQEQSSASSLAALVSECSWCFLLLGRIDDGRLTCLMHTNVVKVAEVLAVESLLAVRVQAHKQSLFLALGIHAARWSNEDLVLVLEESVKRRGKTWICG